MDFYIDLDHVFMICDFKKVDGPEFLFMFPELVHDAFHDSLIDLPSIQNRDFAKPEMCFLNSEIQELLLKLLFIHGWKC